MKLVVVPHGKKLEDVGAYAQELAADPPMTMLGKEKMLALVPALREYGPYDAAYSSTMDRACGTMCTVVKPLGIKRAVCIEELGQFGNKDADGTVIMYPGHEKDDVITWQWQGDKALDIILWDMKAGLGDFSKAHEASVLVFTHRPILAGLVATSASITNPAGIKEILDAKELVGKGFRVFDYDGSLLTLEA